MRLHSSSSNGDRHLSSPGADDAWSTITGHLERRCPGVARQVRSPTAPEWLRRAEEEVGGPLPAVLARWWRLADGMDGHAPLIPHLQTPVSVGSRALRRPA